jgi:hypothetical protein
VKPRVHVRLGLLLAAAVAAGCTSPQFSRIDRHRELYESWPLEVRQAVLDGKVEPGMNTDMVAVAWGKPSEVITRANGPHEDEIWIYRTTTGGDYVDPAGMSPVIPTTTRGATRTGISVGVGGGGIGIGNAPVMPSAPIMVRPPVTTEREVVFRDGVVIRADPPETTP